VQVPAWEPAWEEAPEKAAAEAEWEGTGVEDREVNASARIAERKQSISRGFPATRSTAPNAVQRW
jgi:hypothetical protein